ncbi:MAG: hypothetical protein CMM52_10915 [Rhodospirillaceae bacterium]|mgnify:CR=1 FL=1|nr:hypothetical protein [Rhodospirillaceae bacterium]|tara:strand:- start:24131 stop:24469 length:339 start_codon:yes stop_codon:yes gene_type:complete
MTHALAHTYDVSEREMIVETRDVRVHTLLLTAGQTIPWHKHSNVDDTFLCMTGKMTIRTDSEDAEISLKPGERYTAPAGVGHFVEPATDEGTKFLLIQAVGQHDYIPLDDPA